MVPGTSTNGTVMINNSGDVAGTFTLSKTSLTDTPGANGGQLSGVLDLKVEDVTKEGSPVTVYSGKVGAMGAQSLGSFAAGEARTYKFTIDVPRRWDSGVSDDRGQRLQGIVDERRLSVGCRFLAVVPRREAGAGMVAGIGLSVCLLSGGADE